MSLYSALLRLARSSSTRPAPAPDEAGGVGKSIGGENSAFGISAPYAFAGADGRQAEPGPYVIWSNEHRAWWKPGEFGYSTDFAEAGLYDRQIALALCIGRRRMKDGVPDEIALPYRDAVFIVTGSY